MHSDGLGAALKLPFEVIGRVDSCFAGLALVALWQMFQVFRLQLPWQNSKENMFAIRDRGPRAVDPTVEDACLQPSMLQPG